MATTADPELASRMRLMSLHGLSHDAWGRYSGGGKWDYRILAPGFKYNLTDVAAAIGIHQLARAESMRLEREAVAARYFEALADTEEIELPSRGADRIHSWHLFPIRLRLERLSIDRNAFMDALKAAGVGCSVHWRPLHLHPYYEEKFGWKSEDLPVATREWERLVSLPIFPGMREAEIAHVVETVKGLCRKNRATVAGRPGEVLTPASRRRRLGSAGAPARPRVPARAGGPCDCRAGDRARRGRNGPDLGLSGVLPSGPHGSRRQAVHAGQAEEHAAVARRAAGDGARRFPRDALRTVPAPLQARRVAGAVERPQGRDVLRGPAARGPGARRSVQSALAGGPAGQAGADRPRDGAAPGRGSPDGRRRGGSGGLLPGHPPAPQARRATASTCGGGPGTATWESSGRPFWPSCGPPEAARRGERRCRRGVPGLETLEKVPVFDYGSSS